MIQLPLIPEVMPPVLPAKHYRWFALANAHPSTLWKKASWYPFKESFLHRYATPDGHDLQVIEYACHSCDGGGCHRCTDGVYDRRQIVLARFIFPDGSVFHNPLPLLSRREVSPRSTITGYIRHQGVSENQAVRAALRLWLRHDRQRFIGYVYDGIRAPLSRKLSHIQWRLYCARIRLFNRVQDTDEVPF